MASHGFMQVGEWHCRCDDPGTKARMETYWDEDSADPPVWDGPGLSRWDRRAWEQKGKTVITKLVALRAPDADVVQMVNLILANAAGKPELANSPVSLTELEAARDAAQTALDDEAQAETTLLQKRTLRLDNMVTLRQAANGYIQYVDNVYAPDVAKIQAIGLEIRQDTTVPIGTLPAPSNLRAVLGRHESTILLRWNKVYGTRGGYQAQMATSANGPWTLVYQGPTSNAVIGGLTSGAEYFFRVLAIGAGGEFTPWSDISRSRAA